MPHRSEPPPDHRGQHMSGVPHVDLRGTRMIHPSEMQRLTSVARHPRAPNQMTVYRPPGPIRLPPHPSHIPWRYPSYEAPYRVPGDVEREFTHSHLASRVDAGMYTREFRVEIAANHSIPRNEAGRPKIQARSSTAVDEREAASALLMAAGGKLTSEEERNPESHMATPVSHEDSSDKRNEPLKKRKITLGTSTSPVGGIPCHVSPISNSSLGTAVEVQSDGTPSLNSRTATVVNRSDSFDQKEGQASNESTEVGETSNDPPSGEVDIPRFPSLLHSILSNNCENIIKWTADGHAWRIVRWDALRREILPTYFSKLSEDEKKDGFGSIDSFLACVRGWGFEEITDGPNIGAYQHRLFLRDSPRLCEQMHFEGGSDDANSKSILQVPSLTSSRSDGTSDSKMTAGRHGHPATTVGHPISHVVPLRTRVSPYRAWPHVSRLDQAIQATYRSDEASFGDSPRMRRVTFPPTYDPRFPFRQQGPENASMRAPRHQPVYSPRRVVRSGRGGARMAFVARPPACKEEPAALTRDDSFPVSQRGKGLRGGKPQAAVPSVASDTSQRKAKRRKLPLARNKSPHSGEE